MNLVKAQKLASSFNTHLVESRYIKTYLGIAHISGLIKINSQVLALDWKLAREITLHEIAHVLAWRKAGTMAHDDAWVRECHRLDIPATIEYPVYIWGYYAKCDCTKRWLGFGKRGLSKLTKYREEKWYCLTCEKTWNYFEING